MAIEKTLNTRIQLKYDTLANWSDSTFLLKKGELAIVVIETDDPSEKHLQPVMFKVGTGDKKFSELDWASAKAADVYSWAKKSGIEIEDNGTGKFVTGFTWTDNKLIVSRANVQWDDVENKVKASSTVDGLMSKEDKVKLDGMNLSTGEGIKAEIASGLDEAGIEQVIATKVNSAAQADKVEHALTIGSVTFDGSAAVDITATVESLAAAKINTLIGAADDEGGETIQNITNLVDYVEKNGGQIAKLVTDVETANKNASDAVATAGTAKTTAEAAAATAEAAAADAEEALTAATNAVTGAAASAEAAAESADLAEEKADAAEQARAAAVIAKEAAEEAKRLAEAAQAAAVAAQGVAEDKATLAEGYANTASTKATAAAQSAADAEGFKNDAAQSVTDAAAEVEKAEAQAQAAAGSAQDAASAKTGAESARDTAVQAKADAVAANTTAQTAKTDAVNAKTDAVAAKTAAEDARDEAVAAQGAAATAQEAAEKAKNDAQGILDDVTDAATGAETIANEAKNLATTADQNASAAVQTANAANTTAGEALAAANAETARATGVEAGLRTDVDAIKDDYLKAADKKALQDQINTIMNNPDTEGVINSINEFTQYIAEHGAIADGFRADIDANATSIDELGAYVGELPFSGSVTVLDMTMGNDYEEVGSEYRFNLDFTNNPIIWPTDMKSILKSADNVVTGSVYIDGAYHEAWVNLSNYDTEIVFNVQGINGNYPMIIACSWDSETRQTTQVKITSSNVPGRLEVYCDINSGDGSGINTVVEYVEALVRGETYRAQDEEYALSNRIDALESSMGTEGSVADQISAAIATETAARIAAIADVQAAVTAETERATEAEGGLDTRLKAVEAAVGESGSVVEDIATAKQEAIDTAASDATAKANKALEDAIVKVNEALEAAKTDSSNKDAVVLAEAQKAATTAETNANAYADSLASNYATAEQGAKAETAVQSVTASADEGIKVTREGNAVTIGFDPNVVFVFDCGTALTNND